MATEGTATTPVIGSEEWFAFNRLAALAHVWDECLNAIEVNNLNTEQARDGNPYRAAMRPKDATK